MYVHVQCICVYGHICALDIVLYYLFIIKKEK